MIQFINSQCGLVAHVLYHITFLQHMSQTNVLLLFFSRAEKVIAAQRCYKVGWTFFFLLDKR